MAASAEDKKIALVTGASSGIGRATALALAGKGYSLALNGRDPGRLEQLRLELVREGRIDTALFPVDLSSETGVSEMIDAVYERFGRVDVLVNSAGVIHYAPFEALTAGQMKEMMAVNYWGMVACVRLVLPRMIRQKTGTIVNIASTAGKRGFPMETGYCASKFAVVGFSEALRLELEGTGVNVSLICPGIVDSPMSGSFLNTPGVREAVRPLSCSQVASWVLNAIEKRRSEFTRPWSTRLLIVLNSVWPGLADKIILKRVRWMSKRLSQAQKKAP